ncbi:hypothetical protein DPMN_083027 [Dreissena polymorpha]|nr:hypothetical protein DPMN_083027 [Dreissena polymorpha]
MADHLHLKREGSDVINQSAFGDRAQKTQRLDTSKVQLVAGEDPDTCVDCTLHCKTTVQLLPVICYRSSLSPGP